MRRRTRACRPRRTQGSSPPNALSPKPGFRVLGLGFGVWGLGFRVWGLGFRV